jgi:hypothetical protein
MPGLADSTRLATPSGHPDSRTGVTAAHTSAPPVGVPWVGGGDRVVFVAPAGLALDSVAFDSVVPVPCAGRDWLT